MANTVRVGVGTTGVGKASSDLDNLRDKFAKLQSQGAKGFAIGVGAGVTTAALGLMGKVAGEVTDILADSVRAAMEEEASIAKLGTSLKANIPAWDGNTAAIEKVLGARMALGFSDDEQRQSLALLVGATHDVTKALDIQRTAMDLARIKGISLAEASNALIKVEGGQFRALKALGIVLKEGATATEALAAVQAVAKGQAESYADTTAGKLLVAQTKIGEAMEKFGGVVLPVVADAFSGLADILDKAVNPSMISYAETAHAAERGSFAAEARLRSFKFAADDLAGTADHAAETFERHMWPAITETGDAAGDTAGTLRRDLNPSIEELDRMARDAASSMDDLTDAIFGPTKRKGELAELIEQRRDLVKAGPDSKSISDQDIYNGKLADMNAKILEAGELVAADKGPAALLDWFRKTGAAIGDADSEAAGLLAHMRALADLSGQLPALTGGSWGAIVPGKASGGPVSGGKPFLVGERGPELFVPQSAGNIVPNGAGGSVILNATFNVSGSVSPEQFARDALQALKREVGRQGMSL